METARVHTTLECFCSVQWCPRTLDELLANHRASPSSCMPDFTELTTHASPCNFVTVSWPPGPDGYALGLTSFGFDAITGVLRYASAQTAWTMKYFMPCPFGGPSTYWQLVAGELPDPGCSESSCWLCPAHDGGAARCTLDGG